MKRYPNARNLVPFAALCTLVAQDRPAAKRIRPAVKHDDAPRVWAWQHVAQEFYRWCEAGEIDARRADWIWGTPLNYPALTFAPDSRAVWCASGFGPRAATLWNLDSKKADVALDARGNRMRDLVVDSNKNWVAAPVYGEQNWGWALWDANRMDEPPDIHLTKEPCAAIAIHPKLPQLAWAEGSRIATLDMTTQSLGAAMDVGSEVTAIRYSADGTSIAVTSRQFSVWDISSGGKKFDFPSSSTASSELECEKILDFDDEGRVWAVVYTPGSYPPRYPLVRFSVDGKTTEVMQPNLAAHGPVQPLTATLSLDRQSLAIITQPAKPTDSETIQVWHIASGKMQAMLGHAEHISGLAISPDGKKLASVSQIGGAVSIWSLTATK